ncbi:MAG TPA: cell division protein FtsX [Peptococcaceae bacterium]|nr:MAG: Cell division protein FtsX [Clostridia bacterium 41_269]HBT20865.1 cell division protein FtsX [Peptococcaceae bacterium]
MKFKTFGYFIKQALKSIVRNFWMSFASVATVAVCLIILGAFILLTSNTNYIAQKVESDVEIAVFLYVDTPEEEVRALGDKLEKIPGVASVELVPKEEGLRQLSRQFGEGHDLVSALGGKNPLPDYYIVKAEEPKKVSLIVKEIEKMPHVEKVNYGQGVVEKLFSITRWIRIGGIATIAVLGACTVFLIAVTIRLTIYARRKEINIMKSVGATNWFIRWPFLLEGMFLGFFGSLIASIILYFTYILLMDKISAALSFLPVQKDMSVLRNMILIVMPAGPLIGFLGSLLSLQKYLKI